MEVLESVQVAGVEDGLDQQFWDRVVHRHHTVESVESLEGEVEALALFVQSDVVDVLVGDHLQLDSSLQKEVHALLGEIHITQHFGRLLFLHVQGLGHDYLFRFYSLGTDLVVAQVDLDQLLQRLGRLS